MKNLITVFTLLLLSCVMFACSNVSPDKDVIPGVNQQNVEYSQVIIDQDENINYQVPDQVQQINEAEVEISPGDQNLLRLSYNNYENRLQEDPIKHINRHQYKEQYKHVYLSYKHFGYGTAGGLTA